MKELEQEKAKNEIVEELSNEESTNEIIEDKPIEELANDSKQEKESKREEDQSNPQKPKTGNNNQDEKTKKQNSNKGKKQSRDWALLSDKETGKVSLILSIISLTLGAIIFILCFSPASRINDTSLGNFFNVLFDSLRNIASKIEFLNVSYDYPKEFGRIFLQLHLPTLACLVACYAILENGIKNLRNFFNKKRTVCMNMKFGVVGTSISVIAKIALFASMFIYINFLEKYMLLSMTYQKIICVLVIIEIIACATVKVAIASKSDRIGDSEAYKAVHVKKTIEEISPKPRALETLMTLIFSVAVFWVIITNSYYDIADRYQINKLYLTYKPIDFSNYENPLVVGEEAPDEIYRVVVYDTIVDEVNFSKHKSWSSKSGVNYYYYMILLNDVEEDLLKLCSEEILESDNLEEIEERLGKKFKEFEMLYKKKQMLENQLDIIPCTVESYRRNDEGIVTEYVFNTNRIDKTEHQYGEAPLTVLNLGKESISIDQEVFTKGTDFSEIKIKATVIYSDGSFKISLITPENYEELNNAGVGKHRVEWHDDWGSYSAIITIK